MKSTHPSRGLSLYGLVLLLVAVGESPGCTNSPNPLPPTGRPLAVSSLSPSAGFTAVDTVVQVAGAGFQSGATVTFGEVPAAVIFNSPNILRIIAPAHAAGLADVVVTNPTGERVTVASGYTYQAVTLTSNPDEVTSGAPLTVSWVAPSGRPTGDWIGLFPVEAPSGSSDGWLKYTNGASSGAFTIDAPAQPGVYEFRYLLDGGSVDVARSTVNVTSERRSPDSVYF
jgi:hypothetical protein